MRWLSRSKSQQTMPKPPTPPAAPGTAGNARAANRVPRPVSALARSDPAGHVIAPHRHAREQLIYAIRGVMTIRANGSIWTIPASHALWMPARVVHEIRMDTAVEMRTLYFRPGTVPGMPSDCSVLAVTPLLRELILRALSLRSRYDTAGAEGRLMRVMTDEVALLRRRPLSLRLPTDKRLARLCDHVLAHVDGSESIAELGRRVGLSERSVIRRFPLETGLSLHRWRQQARLMRAFSLMEQGHAVTRIALELGYGSPAAFGKMFRKLTGHSPRAAARLRIEEEGAFR